MSSPPARARSASRRYCAESAGISPPTRIARDARASAASNAPCIRAPRSPCPWERRLTPNRRSHSWKNGSPASGAHHSSTGPSCASVATRRLCITRRRCRAAAPAFPRAEISRVLASPGVGALANTITRQAVSAALAVIETRKARRGGAQEKREAQLPHEENGAQHAMPLPAAARCHRLLGKTERPRDALERARQRDVLHQFERRKTAGALECLAPDEHGLISGGDAGRARAQVHEKSDHRQEDACTFDAHVEPPPRPAARGESLKDARSGGLRQARVGMKENEDFAARERGSRVHLARAAARGRDDAVGGAACEVRSLVARTAVDD